MGPWNACSSYRRLAIGGLVLRSTQRPAVTVEFKLTLAKMPEELRDSPKQMHMTVETPLGPIVVTATDAGVSRMSFVDDSAGRMDSSAAISVDRSSPIEVTLRRELKGYFEGRLREFSIPLDLHGTEFQMRVWQQLLCIPYGRTRSYHELSVRLGDAKAVRAVARANARNPVAIIVPCHRVIGSDGSLTGYAGGLWRKRRLLHLEATGHVEEPAPSLFTEQA